MQSLISNYRTKPIIVSRWHNRTHCSLHNTDLLVVLMPFNIYSQHDRNTWDMPPYSARSCNACICVKLAYSTSWPHCVQARGLKCRPEATVHKLLLSCGSEEVLQKGFSCYSRLRLLAVNVLVHDSYWKLNLNAACLPADHVARSVHVMDLLN